MNTHSLAAVLGDAPTPDRERLQHLTEEHGLANGTQTLAALRMHEAGRITEAEAKRRIDRALSGGTHRLPIGRSI